MVVIDAYRGGGDTGYVGNGLVEKDFNLMISKYINDRLNSLGINTYMTRDTDVDLNVKQRSSLIKEAFGNTSNIIAISNRLNNEENGVEIIYSLKNSNSLANKFEKSFKDRNIYVNKIYQKRDENDTSLDYDDLLKNTGNIETIIINYGNILDQKDANNLKNNYKEYAESIIEVIATRLGVPYSNTSNMIYIVQKGDSLWSISKKYGLSVDELKEYNNLSTNLLNVNQILKIPEKNTYIVVKGDSLWSISKKYNTTVDSLKNINNLTGNILNIGQVLKIPKTNTYIVQKGDTLWSIAKNNSTTVDKLKTINNLKNNSLNIGQVLILS